MHLMLIYTFQISKIKRSTLSSTSRKCRKLFRLWWVKSFFSKYSKFKCDSVDQLLAQQKCCPLPASSKRCLFHWSYQSSSQGSGHHNLHYGINLFQKVAGFFWSFLFLLITESPRITMTLINVILLIWGFVQGNFGYIILRCRNTTFHF